jgi:hypothetical protein
VPIGGIGHHAHHPGGFSEYDRIGTTGPRKLEPCGDEAVAYCASWTPPRALACFSCRVPDRHGITVAGIMWTASTYSDIVDSVHF